MVKVILEEPLENFLCPLFSRMKEKAIALVMSMYHKIWKLSTALLIVSSQDNPSRKLVALKIIKKLRESYFSQYAYDSQQFGGDS